MLHFQIINVERSGYCYHVDDSTFTSLKKKSIHPPTCKSSLGHFLPFPSFSWWFNGCSCKTPVCSRRNGPSQAKPSPLLARVGPLIYLRSIVFLHFEFLFHHQPLPCHQPWESLITQDDNMETIKPTYFSKTASLLSLLWAIKISHSSHRPLKHWT